MLIGNIDPLVTRKMQRKEKSTLQHSILVEREEKRLKLMQVVDKEVVNLDDELAEDISQSTCRPGGSTFHLVGPGPEFWSGLSFWSGRAQPARPLPSGLNFW